MVGSAWGLLPPAPGSRILSGMECRTQNPWPAGIPQQGMALGELPLTGRSDPGNNREGRGLHGDGSKLRVCVKGESQNYQSLSNIPWECNQHFNQAYVNKHWKTNISLPRAETHLFHCQLSLSNTLGQRNAVGLTELKFAGQ